jgi:hypothetical protein
MTIALPARTSSIAARWKPVIIREPVSPQRTAVVGQSLVGESEVPHRAARPARRHHGEAGVEPEQHERLGGQLPQVPGDAGLAGR